MQNEGAALELSTFSSKDSTVTLNPSSLSETSISVAGPSTSGYTSGIGGPSTSSYDSAIESVPSYESYSYSVPDRFTSSEDIYPRYRYPSEGEEHSGENMTLKRRLMHRRHRMQFLDYAAYAIDSVYEEMEKIIILDVVFILLSVITFGIGVGHVDKCRASPTIPVMMGVCGGVDAIINSMGVASSFVRRRPWCQQFLKDTVRSARAILFFVHLYSVGVVYSCWPPEEKDGDSPNYCHPTVFWAAFAFFHITSLTSLAIIVGMVTAVLWYFM